MKKNKDEEMKVERK